MKNWVLTVSAFGFLHISSSFASIAPETLGGDLETSDTHIEKIEVKAAEASTKKDSDVNADEKSFDESLVIAYENILDKRFTGTSCEKYFKVVNCPDAEVRPLIENALTQVDKTKMSSFSLNITAGQLKILLEDFLSEYEYKDENGHRAVISLERAQMILDIFRDIINK